MFDLTISSFSHISCPLYYYTHTHIHTHTLSLSLSWCTVYILYIVNIREWIRIVNSHFGWLTSQHGLRPDTRTTKQQQLFLAIFLFFYSFSRACPSPDDNGAISLNTLREKERSGRKFRVNRYEWNAWPRDGETTTTTTHTHTQKE